MNSLLFDSAEDVVADVTAREQSFSPLLDRHCFPQSKTKLVEI